MTIGSTYKKTYIEDYILDLLKTGVIPSVTELENAIASFNERDYNRPVFDADNFKITETNEVSSVSKFTNMVSAVYADLGVLYEELKELTKRSISQYERWDTELLHIEGKARDLESRMGDLLLLAEDTEGYINFVADYFRDLSLVDQDNTTAFINPATHTVTLPFVTSTHQIVELDTNLIDKNVFFRVSARGATLSQSSETSRLANAFSDLSTFWLSKALANQQGPVTGELKVKLGDTPVEISKIEFTLHSSNYSTPCYITVLYSSDGYIYQQIPCSLPTQAVTDTAVFAFTSVEATHVKFLMTKQAADYFENGKYIYEFGAKLIQFFSENFETIADLGTSSSRAVLISKPLYVLDQNQDPIEFSKLSLTTCEGVDPNATIRYFVTVSNDETVPLSSSTEWIAIDPTNRVSKESHSAVDIGNLDQIVIGDTETVTISYNAGGGAGLINPGASFYLVEWDDTTEEFISTAKTATLSRYIPVNYVDRILNYQFSIPKFATIAESIDEYFLIDYNSLYVYRNLGEKGLLSSVTVRDILRGWGYLDPYYYCVVEITNTNGLPLDVGDEPIYIDNKLLRNNIVIPYGIHYVKVHKNNWYYVTHGLTTLNQLVAADPLYPYNHKLLIEGYSYGAGFDTNEQVYTGVDVYAEALMKKVSVFDFNFNVAENDYTRYAIDWDIPNSYLNNYGNLLFLVKIDPNKADYDNEQWLIKFKAVDQKFKYLRFKAELETIDESLTPILMSYKIKMG